MSIRIITAACFMMTLFCTADLPVKPEESQFNTLFREKTVGIVVNRALYPSIAEQLEIYISDLNEIEGYRCWVNTSFDAQSSAKEVRDTIKVHYQQENLKGVIFIGDLPIVWYELEKDDYNTSYSSFPIDLYYMYMTGEFLDTALYGEWNGSARTGYFDGFEGNLKADIWVSRLVPSTIDGDQATLVNAYFRRVYSRMHDFDTLPSRALSINTNGLNLFGCLTCLYQNENIDELLSDTMTKKDYLERLRHGYEYAVISAHGAAAITRIGSEVVTIDDLFASRQSSGGELNTRFYYLYICSNCDYSQKNMGTSLVLSNNGLICLGSTKVGAIYDRRELDFSLFQGLSFGESYQALLNNSGDLSSSGPPFCRIIGTTMFGAATLQLKKYNTKLRHTVYIASTSGGTTSKDGRNIIDDGGDLQFLIYPEDEFELAGVYIDGTRLDSVVSCSSGSTDECRTNSKGTLKEIRGDHKVLVEFRKRKQYDLNVSVNSIGKFSVDRYRYYEHQPVMIKFRSDRFDTVIDSLWRDGEYIIEASEKATFWYQFAITRNSDVVCKFKQLPLDTVKYKIEGDGEIFTIPSDSTSTFAITKPDTATGKYQQFLYQYKDVTSIENGFVLRRGSNLALRLRARANSTLSEIIIDGLSSPLETEIYFDRIGSNHDLKVVFDSLK